MFFRPLAIAAILSIAPLTASATVLKFSFEGEVESVNDGANANLPAGLGPYQVGDTLAGSFLLDTSLMTGGMGSQADYGGAVSDLSVEIDGNTYTSSGAGSASVRNDNMAGSSAPLRDMFIANFGPVSGPDAGGEAVAGFQFSLGGTDAFAAGSLSGVEAPSIAEFLSLFANDNNDGNTKFLNFEDSNNPGISDVRYDVTGLTVEALAPVPLPAGLPLLLAGLGGLGALRMRKRG